MIKIHSKFNDTQKPTKKSIKINKNYINFSYFQIYLFLYYHIIIYQSNLQQLTPTMNCTCCDKFQQNRIYLCECQPDIVRCLHCSQIKCHKCNKKLEFMIISCCSDCKTYKPKCKMQTMDICKTCFKTKKIKQQTLIEKWKKIQGSTYPTCIICSDKIYRTYSPPTITEDMILCHFCYRRSQLSEQLLTKNQKQYHQKSVLNSYLAPTYDHKKKQKPFSAISLYKKQKKQLHYPQKGKNIQKILLQVHFDYDDDQLILCTNCGYEMLTFSAVWNQNEEGKEIPLCRFCNKYLQEQKKKMHSRKPIKFKQKSKQKIQKQRYQTEKKNKQEQYIKNTINHVINQSKKSPYQQKQYHQREKKKKQEQYIKNTINHVINQPKKSLFSSSLGVNNNQKKQHNIRTNFPNSPGTLKTDQKNSDKKSASKEKLLFLRKTIQQQEISPSSISNKNNTKQLNENTKYSNQSSSQYKTHKQMKEYVQKKQMQLTTPSKKQSEKLQNKKINSNKKQDSFQQIRTNKDKKQTTQNQLLKTSPKSTINKLISSRQTSLSDHDKIHETNTKIISSQIKSQIQQSTSNKITSSSQNKNKQIDTIGSSVIQRKCHQCKKIIQLNYKPVQQKFCSPQCLHTFYPSS